MTDKITIKNCTLYLGDARDILPSLGECADCIVSDPPYKLAAGGNRSGKLGGILSTENYNNSGDFFYEEGDKPFITWKEIMNLYYSALKENTHCYVFTNDKNIRESLNEGEAAKFRFHNMLVWNKVSPTPNRWYMKNLEYIEFLFKGEAKYINDMGSTQLTTLHNNKETDHPTEKPVKLLEKYILNSTRHRETVLDPFFGSGSTAIACLNTKRNFIGIEKNKEWYDVTIERITNHTEQHNLMNDEEI